MAQGRREFMEDTHVVAHFPWGRADGAWASVFALFDGHGGRACSTFCADVIVPHILAAAQVEPNPAAALKSAFLTTDSAYIASDQHSGSTGSTALVTLMINNGAEVWVANVGDSRAVLVAQSGTASALTLDHKPVLPDEKARIVSSGGFVYMERANGALAVSRAMGDQDLKSFGVIAAPDVASVDTRGSVAMIMATDGLWDVVSNEEAGGLVAHVAHAMMLLPTWPQIAADSLLNLALGRGSRDNVSVIVISTQRPAAPPQSIWAAIVPAAAAAEPSGEAAEEAAAPSKAEYADEPSAEHGKRGERQHAAYYSVVPTTTFVQGDTPEDGLMITRTRKFVSGDWIVKSEGEVHGTCHYGQMCRSAKCTRAHYATLGRARWAARWRGSELQFLKLRDGGLQAALFSGPTL